MPDLPETVKREVHWDKYGTLPAGTRIWIQIDTGSGLQTVLDRTVPAGKQFQARIAIDGDLK